MNTTQQSDSPVEDVNETLPQPRPLPTIAAGASTSIISGAADSSNDEIVASDLIEPAANNLPQPIITNQGISPASLLGYHDTDAILLEYLHTSFVDSTSTAAWPCFAESLALRERTISHESMDSGYQSSSPNEASTSAFTTSHAIWTAELPSLPPLATQAQGNLISIANLRCI